MCQVVKDASPNTINQDILNHGGLINGLYAGAVNGIFPDIEKNRVVAGKTDDADNGNCR